MKKIMNGLEQKRYRFDKNNYLNSTKQHFNIRPHIGYTGLNQRIIHQNVNVKQEVKQEVKLEVKAEVKQEVKPEVKANNLIRIK